MSLGIEIAAGVGWAFVVAGAGGALTRLDSWYDRLKRPRLQPPDWAFGPAWTIILALAATAAVLAWRAAPDDGARTLVLVLMGANAALNILWNLLFFTIKRPDYALAEVAFLWLSILAPIVAFHPFSPAAAWLLAPYLVWVGFASYLNLGIVRLNAPFGAGPEPGSRSRPARHRVSQALQNEKHGRPTFDRRPSSDAQRRIGAWSPAAADLRGRPFTRRPRRRPMTILSIHVRLSSIENGR